MTCFVLGGLFFFKQILSRLDKILRRFSTKFLSSIIFLKFSVPSHPSGITQFSEWFISFLVLLLPLYVDFLYYHLTTFKT